MNVSVLQPRTEALRFVQNLLVLLAAATCAIGLHHTVRGLNGVLEFVLCAIAALVAYVVIGAAAAITGR